MIETPEYKIVRNKVTLIWVLLGIYCVAFAFICANRSVSSIAAEILLIVCSFLTSAFLLVRHRLPSGKHITIACVLSVLSVLYLILEPSTISLTSLVPAFNVFLSSVAVFSVTEQFPDSGITLLRHTSKRDVIISVLIGIACGVVWGILNYYAMKGSNPLHSETPLRVLICALRPAIWEELSFRAVFVALCISIFDGDNSTKRNSLTTWIMIILPHVLPHTVESFRMSVLNGIISMILLAVLFGIVFAILQRKRDIASAVIAHGIVDFIRFMFFGVPFVL